MNILRYPEYLIFVGSVSLIPIYSNVSPCFFFPFPLVEIQYWQNYWNTLRFHKKKEVRHWTVLKNIPKITSGGWSASGLATPTCWCVNLYQQPPKKRKEPLFLSYVLYIYIIFVYTYVTYNIYIYKHHDILEYIPITPIFPSIKNPPWRPPQQATAVQRFVHQFLRLNISFSSAKFDDLIGENG